MRLTRLKGVLSFESSDDRTDSSLGHPDRKSMMSWSGFSTVKYLAFKLNLKDLRDGKSFSGAILFRNISSPYSLCSASTW